MGNELVTNVVGEINAQLQSNGIDQQLNITGEYAVSSDFHIHIFSLHRDCK